MATAKAQREGMGSIKSELHEAVCKEMKGINTASLNKIKAFASKNPSDRVVTFILDNMTRFMSNGHDSKYNAQLFANENDCLNAIKSADYGCLDKSAIEAIMNGLLPGVDGESGAILRLMEDEKNAQRYMEFFPFVKTLSKMCYLAMLTRKEMSLQARVETADFQAKRIAATKEAYTLLNENNGFVDRLAKEQSRLNAEIYHYEKKVEALRRTKDEINNKLKNFAQLYL